MKTKTEIGEFILRMTEQDWWTRQRSIGCLLALPEDDFIGYLAEGIRNHDDASVRNISMEIMSAMGPRGLPCLKQLFKDRDPDVRLFVVNILCRMATADTLPLLEKAISDHDVNVRIAAVEAVGYAGNSEHVGLLSSMLNDEPWVVMAAIESLGRIGGDEALGHIHANMKHREYRPMAIAALERAGNTASIKYLTSCFGENELRAPAIRAIMSISEREKARPNPEYFITIVPMLIEMLDSGDRFSRNYALKALSWSQDMAAVPYFLEAIKEDDLQEDAIEGLLLVGRRALCSIVDEIKASAGSHRKVLAKILEMTGEEKALLQFAGDPDPGVRIEVALAIAGLDLARAARALETMLSDPSEEVRLAAKKGLHNRGDNIGRE